MGTALAPDLCTIWGCGSQATIGMGTAPAPDLANDFAVTHEFIFTKAMMNSYAQAKMKSGVPPYPLEFIKEYGGGGKRFMDNVLAARPALQSSEGPTFEQTLKQDRGTYDGIRCMR